jgi:glycosyltransferase involved in cell wall biosynthesis
MTRRTKLLLLIPHLGGGGAEGVAAHLARHLDRQRFEIHLCLITKDCAGARPPSDGVQVHRFEAKRVRNAWFQLIRLIRARQPDVILSSMAHLNFQVLLIKPLLPRRARILVRQNTTASAAARSWYSRLPYRCLYPRADAILCQSEAMAADLADNFGLAKSKLEVLANPIDVRSIRASSSAPGLEWNEQAKWPSNSSPRLLTVGRLAREKGIDLLLRALVAIKRQYSTVHLTILGTGPEEAAIRDLVRELKLEDTVSLPGYINSPEDYYASATLFVLPSRYEGMPNALLEAAAAGLPLVATPCCAGVCELLQDAPGTWLASSISVDALAEALLTALTALTSQQELPPRLDHAFLSPFEIGTAIAAYQDLIDRFAAQRNP